MDSSRKRALFGNSRRTQRTEDQSDHELSSSTSSLTSRKRSEEDDMPRTYLRRNSSFGGEGCQPVITTRTEYYLRPRGSNDSHDDEFEFNSSHLRDLFTHSDCVLNQCRRVSSPSVTIRSPRRRTSSDHKDYMQNFIELKAERDNLKRALENSGSEENKESKDPTSINVTVKMDPGPTLADDGAQAFSSTMTCFRDCFIFLSKAVWTFIRK